MFCLWNWELGRKRGGNTTVASLVDRLDKTPSAVCMEISAEKTKLMTTTQMTSALTWESTAKIWNNRTVLSIWAQLWQIKVPSLKYRPGLHRRQQHYQNWRPSGTKRISPLPKRSNCAPLLSRYSFIPVKPGHWQRTCRINCTPLR